MSQRGEFHNNKNKITGVNNPIVLKNILCPANVSNGFDCGRKF